jgi:hypothetical protein
MEGKRLMSWASLLILVSLGLTGAADDDWRTSAFPERAYDFGVVARGSRIRHAFPIVNRTNSEIRIVDWKTKCGCTDVKVGARVIPPGAQTTVEATIDTTKFQGPKASGLRLMIDRPVWDEIDLNLTCFIRADLTLVPGLVDFGTVRRSTKPVASTLILTYSGPRSDWAITALRTQTARIKAEARELDRTHDGRVHWQITTQLDPSGPTGFFKDEITVVSNDPGNREFPISVAANIQGAVSISPSILNFGTLQPGQTVTKVVHVRSSAPFTITELSSSAAVLAAKQLKEGQASDHAINLTLHAPAAAGPLHATVDVRTDLQDEPAARVKAFANVARNP